MEIHGDLGVRFEELIAMDEAAMPLDEVCLVIAAHAVPRLDVGRELRRVDDLAGSVRVPTLDGLRDHLYGTEGFAGDRSTYYDPRNSYLHDVIARRRGIPITLSVLTICVGRRIGVPLEGVGMPGHFLVRDKVDRSVYVDCFAGGSLLDEAACRRRFHELFGSDAPFEVSYLDPVGSRAIVLRVLANLASIHRAAGDHEGAVWVQRLRLAVPGTPDTEWADYASVLAAAGRIGEAAAAFDVAAERLGGELGIRCTGSAQRLRARLN